MNWLRLYTELLDDIKIAELSDKEFRHFVYLLCMAAQEEKEGLIPCPVKSMAWRLRTTTEELPPSIEKMKSLEILSQNGVGIEFINWKKRQFRSDNVTERVRKHREKKRAEGETLHETEDETLENRAEQSREEQIDIPRKEIVGLYHQILGELPKVKAWTDKRQKALKARWREDKKRQNLEWWRKYFEYVKESPFLMGKSKEDFRADIDFLISPKLLNVIEGRYHQG
jgi:hypothetical protein